MTNFLNELYIYDMENEDKKQFIFNWKIENYDYCFQKCGESLKSPEFTSEILLGSRWHLLFYPNGLHNEYKDHCSIFLNRNETDRRAPTIIVDYTVEIFSCNGERLALHECAQKTFQKMKSWGCQLFCKIEDISNELSGHTEKSITIRCIINRHKTVKPIIGCDAKTSFEVERYSFPWIIKMNDVSDAKIFTFSNTSKFKISLFYSSDLLMVNISKLNRTSSQIMHCKISLLDAEDNEKQSKRESRLFMVDVGAWKFPFVKKSELGTALVKLIFEFSSSNKCSSEIVKTNYATSPESDSLLCVDTFRALHEDLNRLYINKTHSDVTLTVGDKIFPVHKSILLARSPIFRTMFNQQMLENQTSNIDITDFGPMTMAAFLQFLYTGFLDMKDFKISLNLFVMADKYQVLSLKEKCALFLISILSTENIFEILCVADLIKHAILKESVIDYISSHAGAILSSSKWIALVKSNNELGSEILCKVSLKLGSEIDNTFRN